MPEASSSWVLPLLHERITSFETPLEKAAGQLKQVCDGLKHRPLSLWDSEYGCASFVKQTAVIHLGEVQDAATLVIVADFFMKMAEATCSIVSGILDQKLIVIFRNAGFRRDAGKLAKEMFGHIGSAGGHKSMARAEIPLERIKPNPKTAISIEQYVLNRLKRVGGN